MVKKLTIYCALEPFLTKPFEKLHLAHISREINEPHPTVRQWLNALEEKGVLTKSHKGRLTLYSLNIHHLNIIDYLVISEKNKLIKECEKWAVLGEITSYISKNFGESAKVLVFGSAAESFKTAKDIDLLIAGKDKTQGLKNLAKRLNKEPHIVQAERLEKVSGALRAEIIKKHLLIKGSEDILRWMLWPR
ncbi:hypothetical protein HYS31_06950 [Candidatus Woesearchaeota archaeon]|nr:hypothetical protein [Candidatus Woesearchaeota archaeon]